LDDCQVAADVIAWLVPSESVSVAVNCADWPTPGVAPLTEMDDTAGIGEGGVGVAATGFAELDPHDVTSRAAATRTPSCERFI
jgi:hypothetical protein